MQFKLIAATAKDASEIATLRTEVAEHLTLIYGRSYWSLVSTERGVFYNLKTSKVFIARKRNRIIASLNLATKKPWAIDKSYFTDCKRPLYLTNMAVAPGCQRQGVGKLCIEEVIRITKNWPADSIRLDAYNSEAGAGEFYRKCGFREVERVVYRNVPLIYYEMLL